MFHPVKDRAVTKPDSENGRQSSSEESGFVTVDLMPDKRSLGGVARAHDRPAVGRAAEQTDRLGLGGSTSSRSKDRCSAPGLARTAERALSSNRKKESTMPVKTEPDFVGLDIAKDQLDYCLNDRTEGRCPNTTAGRVLLIQQLRQLAHPRVIVEASGGYEKVVVAELLQAGIEVCVVQPGRVRALAYAEGLLAKTDRIDARLLRRYGQKVELRLAAPTDPATANLRELLEHRRALSTQLVEVEGRLALAGPTLHKLLEVQRAFLEQQLATVEKLIHEHIDQNPDLRAKAERMQQVKGVGPILAATLLAYVPELGKVESAQLSALVGVAPHPKDSGPRSSPRHIRGGRPQVRIVLYMAAVCATRWNPILAAFYRRLRANGKPAPVCLVAVMRKLVCLLNRLIQNPNFALAS